MKLKTAVLHINDFLFYVLEYPGKLYRHSLRSAQSHRDAKNNMTTQLICKKIGYELPYNLL